MQVVLEDEAFALGRAPAGAGLRTQPSAAELNPALAPRGLDVFVLRLEHLWDLQLED